MVFLSAGIVSRSITTRKNIIVSSKKEDKDEMVREKRKGQDKGR